VKISQIILQKLLLAVFLALGLLFIPVTDVAWADEAAKIDTGSTAWMITASVLVLMMTPALALFYGGLVRSRNVLNTMMMCFLPIVFVGVTWVLWGYSLSFSLSPEEMTMVDGTMKAVAANPFIGNLNWFGLNGVAFGEPSAIYAPSVPHEVFAIYQMTFAIITPALISGAIVERMTFKAYFWFILLWSTFIYPPLAHMVWGKGYIETTIGAIDFAGGTVVHISSGVSALVLAAVVGSRRTYPSQSAPPHNVTLTLWGAGFLVVGWLGFNGGSAFAANGLAAVAILNTIASACAGGLTWTIVEWILRGKPTAVGIATGLLAGLVGMTSSAGFVSPLASLLIGSLTSIVCFFGVSLRSKLQFDDSLDAFPVHGLGGTIGALLTGVFADKAYNPAGADGLLKGDPALLGKQFIAVAITWVFAAVGTFLILKLISLVIALRVNENIEDRGLDVHLHGEEAYGDFVGGTSVAGMPIDIDRRHFNAS
jgi:ammonium transporter, Amt family